MNSTRETALSTKRLRRSWDALSERERKVVHAVVERLHVSRPIHAELPGAATFGQRLADLVTRFGGSWWFIGLFCAVITTWMLVNSLMLAGPFDPFPFILLNLALSCLAAIQAPVILMSQGRQADYDRERATHDYEVNLKAELEIMELHEKIDLLRTEEMSRIVDLQERLLKHIESLARGTPPSGD